MSHAVRPHHFRRPRQGRVLPTACALLAALTVTAGGGSADAADQAGWIARHHALDQAVRGGQGYSQVADASTLSWGESYILSSYVSLYRTTGDPAWIDKLAAHADAILANATDPDGDGFRGWGTFRYSESQAPNGSFDAKAWPLPAWLTPASLRDLPKGWTRWQSSRQTARRAVEGENAYAQVKTDPARGWQVLQARLGHYTPGARYQVSFRGRTNGSAAGGRVDILDRTAGRVLGQQTFTDRAWTVRAFEFAAPTAAGREVLVRLFHRDYRPAGGEADFDDVKVKRHVEWTVHHGMIAFPLVQLAAIVHNDPALRATHGRLAQRILRLVEHEIVPRWEPFYRAIDARRGTYIFPDEAAYGRRGNSLPHNQYLAGLGRVFVALYQATGQPAYLTRAEALGRTFRSFLRTKRGAYEWNYSDVLLPTDRFKASGAEDTSHGNIDVGFVLELHALGRVFTDRDVERFTATFESRMWNGRFSHPALARHVDGSGDDAFSPYAGDWVGLGEHPGSRTFEIVDALFERGDFWTPTGALHLPTAMLVAARLAGARSVRNGGMEAAALGDPSRPAGWTRRRGGQRGSRRSRAAARTGSFGLALRKTSPWRSAEVQQPLPPLPLDTPLVVTWAARTLRGSGRGRLEVWDQTANRRLAVRRFATARWQPQRLAFTTPRSLGHRLALRVGLSGGRGSALDLDDVVLEGFGVQNGGFEAPEPRSLDPARRRPTLPAHWERWQSSAQTASLDAQAPHRGGYAVTLRSDPSRGWQVLEQRLGGYRPGANVRLSFYGMTNGSAAGGRVQVYDFTAHRTLADVPFGAIAWTRYTAAWQMPAAAGHAIRIRLMHERWNVAGGVTRFDDVRLD